MNRPKLRVFSALLALALALSACGGDDEVTNDDVAADAEATAANEVEVTAVDYAFEGITAEVAAGTKLTFSNSSEAEVHEMVLFAIAEGEERSVTDLLALGEEEGAELMAFKGVAFGFPGEEATYPEGDTTVTDPGRYALVCFLPVGGDVAAIKEAMENRDEESTEPPDFGDGPPHFTRGMTAEFTVS